MKKSKGLGDSIAKITEATGLKKIVDKISEATGIDCGCEERKEYLNKLYPYARTFTKDEMEIYEEILPSIKNRRINKLEQKSLLKIYNKVFKARKEMTNCSSCINQTLKKLEEVYVNSCKL